MNKNIKWFETVKGFVPFVILPMFLLAISGSLQKARGPHFVDRDPTYAYLFNSLSVLNGYSPFHRDHPGTPVQTLGALTLRLAYPKSTVQEISSRVIRNPESSIELIRYSIIVFCGILQTFAGWRVARNFKSIPLGVFFQTIPWISLAGWEFLTSITSDLLLLSLSIYFFSFLSGDCENYSSRLPVQLGLVLGIMGVTKVTAGTLGLIPVFLFWRTPKNLFLFFLFLAIGLFLGSAPLLVSWRDNLGYIFHWVLNNATHEKQYGEGSVGVISFLDWTKNVSILFFGNFLVPLSLLLCWLFRQRKPYIIVFFCILIQVSVIAKSPRDYYLFPIFGGVALTGVYCLSLVRNKTLFVCIGLLCFILIGRNVYSSLNSAPYTQSELNDIETLKQESLRTPCRLVFSGAPQFEFALAFGNNFSGKKFTTQLEEFYPGLLFYDQSQNNFWSFSLNSVMPVNLEFRKNLCLIEKLENSSKLKLIKKTASGLGLFLLGEHS